NVIASNRTGPGLNTRTRSFRTNATSIPGTAGAALTVAARQLPCATGASKSSTTPRATAWSCNCVPHRAVNPFRFPEPSASLPYPVALVGPVARPPGRRLPSRLLLRGSVMHPVSRALLPVVLGLALAGCTPKPFDGPTVDAFNGRVVRNGEPVSF